jgi:hypothetical protein
MNVENLLKALDNEDNSKLLNLTSKKILEMKLEILKELQLSKKEITEISKKLKNYMYIDEINELRDGSYIRWICIKNPKKIFLTKGAVLCEIKIVDDGVQLTCKTFTNSFFSLKMEENIIFQKLTDQEKVLLLALDQLIL